MSRSYEFEGRSIGCRVCLSVGQWPLSRTHHFTVTDFSIIIPSLRDFKASCGTLSLSWHCHLDILHKKNTHTKHWTLAHIFASQLYCEVVAICINYRPAPSGYNWLTSKTIFIFILNSMLYRLRQVKVSPGWNIKRIQKQQMRFHLLS